MKIRINEAFEGYPDGTDKSRTFYKAGQVVEVPDEFAKLVIGKGHATADAPAAAAAVVPAPAPKPVG